MQWTLFKNTLHCLPNLPFHFARGLKNPPSSLFDVIEFKGVCAVSSQFLAGGYHKKGLGALKHSCLHCTLFCLLILAILNEHARTHNVNERRLCRRTL